MKKIIALLLAALMLLSLAGCEGKPDTGTTGEATKETQGTVLNPGESGDLTVHENVFFTVGYDEADGWTLTEDDYYTSEYGGNAELRILDADGYTEIGVSISAYEEEAASFRETLYNYGIDLKAYAEGTWEREQIGGEELAYADNSYGERCFLGRDAAAGVSYCVIVDNWEDARVSALIENITFTASGTDNIDPPWYWEGEAFTGSSMSQTVGSYTLTAEFVPIEVPMITYETFNHDIAVLGDKVYLLSDGILHEYAYNGSSLTYVDEVSMPDYEVLGKDAEGNLILSNFMESTLWHDGTSELSSYEGPSYFSVAPNGQWGISWFYSGDECELYSFREGTLLGSPFPFPEVDSVSQINIDNDFILVSGTSVEDQEHYIFVYDGSGELQMQLAGDPDGFGLGSITYAKTTPNGFLALDGNMREIVLWAADGTWIGAVDAGDLFGTSYPWIAAGDLADDGSIFVVMSEERADKSADEVLVFKLSGF